MGVRAEPHEDYLPSGRILIEKSEAAWQIAVHVNQGTLLSMLARDVQRGLSSRPKYLPPKYFYDERGSALFQRISGLPEYYLTRVEQSIIESVAGGLVAELRPEEIVELGPGTSGKVRHLLDANGASGHVVRYVPFDLDGETMEAGVARLVEDFPYLAVHGVIGDLELHLSRVPLRTGRRLVVFFGSTIGNLDAEARHDLLVHVRRLLTVDDRLLLGVDLVKEVALLEAAYNDASGVTAEFNRNILRVVNRGLGGDFLPDVFRHHAYYDAGAGRVEMNLVADSPQTAHLKDLDLTVQVSAGETIWTESCYKFTRESTEGMLEEAGMRLERWYADGDRMYALALAAPR